MTLSALHPSNAGIGRRLKIAKASDIIPAKARSCRRPHWAYTTSIILTIPTGPERVFTDHCILFLLNERRFFPRVPSAVKVILLSAIISSHHATTAFQKGNCMIGNDSCSEGRSIHRRHSSLAHCIVLVCCTPLRSNTIAIDFPSCCCSTVLSDLYCSTLHHTLMIVSPVCIPALAARDPSMTHATRVDSFFGARFGSMIHCSSRNVLLVMR
jgi:hypothetical protein